MVMPRGLLGQPAPRLPPHTAGQGHRAARFGEGDGLVVAGITGDRGVARQGSLLVGGEFWPLTLRQSRQQFFDVMCSREINLLPGQQSFQILFSTLLGMKASAITRMSSASV